MILFSVTPLSTMSSTINTTAADVRCCDFAHRTLTFARVDLIDAASPTHTERRVKWRTRDSAGTSHAREGRWDAGRTVLALDGDADVHDDLQLALLRAAGAVGADRHEFDRVLDAHGAL